MAKTNKYVHFNTRAAFEAELNKLGVTDPSAAEGNDFYYYTVFIKDTGEIYTHGKFYSQNYFELSYEEIKKLRDTSKLIPGAKYRMIDYITTVSTYYSNVSVDNIPFDIILTAISKNQLSPNACVCRRNETDLIDRDVQSWKIWYDIDNKYWSDSFVVSAYNSGDSDFTESFKQQISSKALISDGMIYDGVVSWDDYMLRKGDVFVSYGYTTDPWGNRCLTLYKTDPSVSAEADLIDKYIYWGYSNEHNAVMFRLIDGTEFTYDSGPEKYILLLGAKSDYIVEGQCEEEIIIESVGHGVIYRMIDEFGNDIPFDFINIYNSSTSKKISGNNNVVQFSNGELYVPTIEGQNNHICAYSSPTIKGNENVVGFYTSAIYILGDSNNIGNRSQNISLSQCLFNKIGDLCNNISMDSSEYITIENNCTDIEIRGYYNHIGAGCSMIYCDNMEHCAFGNGCSEMYFQHNYMENCTFGNGCSDFYSFDHGDVASSHNIKRLIVDNGVRNVIISSTEDVISLHISGSCTSMNGTDPTWIFLDDYFGEQGSPYHVCGVAMRNSDGEIKVFNPADLIA